MKKTLLTMATVVLTTASVWADQTTFDFEGKADLAGLTRQTTIQVNDMTFVKEIAYSQDGIDFKLNATDGTGSGYALVYAPTNKDPHIEGIYISKQVGTAITVTVPGGNITGAKLVMSGYAMNSLEIDFNGKAVEPASDAGLYSWTWADAGGGSTLTLSWPATFGVRYIHSLELTYTPDLGGKEAPGLAFSMNEAETIMGQEFDAPVLSNPYRLPIVWSSSDENVAKVSSDGAVTPVGAGKAMIKAATEGNDKYGPGNAQYKLTVIPSADNVPQLKEDAPVLDDKVYVNFPMTVTFANISAAFVVDAQGNATLIWNSMNDNSTSSNVTNIYKPGDVIPAGWLAVYNNQKGFTGIPGKVTETTEVTYAKVSSVSYKEDADRVVILKNVTFDESTGKRDKFKGTTPNGTTYSFENTYGVGDQPAGTYNVKLVVRYAVIGTTVYEWLAPIEYLEATPEVDPEFPEEFKVSVDAEGLNVVQTPADEESEEPYTILVQGEIKEAKATLTIDVPEGWDGFISLDNSITPYDGKQKAKSEWAPLDEFLSWGFKKGNVFEIPADNMYHSYNLYLYKDDRIDEANPVMVNAYVTRDLSGLDLSFPATFDVTLSVAGLKTEQSQETEADYTMHNIVVSGEADAETVTLTLAVPEGWTGYVGATDADTGESDVNPMATRSDAVFNLWPLSYLEGSEVPLKEGNSFTFPVDGETHYGMCYLYIDEMFCDASINIEVTVKKGEGAGVNEIETSAGDVRFFNLQGVEVKNPENGVFVKVAGGKASKVTVK